RLDSRIHLHGERLLISAITSSKPDDVRTSLYPRSHRRARSISVNRGDGIGTPLSRQRMVVKVPNEPVRSRLGGQCLGRANPVSRDIELLLNHFLLLDRARINPHRITLVIEDFEHDPL